MTLSWIWGSELITINSSGMNIYVGLSQVLTSAQGSLTGFAEVVDRAAVRLAGFTFLKVFLEGFRTGIATRNPLRVLNYTEYGPYSPLNWAYYRALTGPIPLGIPPSLLTLVSESGFCAAEPHALEVAVERFTNISVDRVMLTGQELSSITSEGIQLVADAGLGFGSRSELFRISQPSNS